MLCFYEKEKFQDVLQRSMARNLPVDALFPLLLNALFRFLPKRHSEKVFEDAGRFFVILTGNPELTFAKFIRVHFLR